MTSSRYDEQLIFALDNQWQVEDLREWSGRLDLEKARILDNDRN